MASPDSLLITYSKPKYTASDPFSLVSNGKISGLYTHLSQMPSNQITTQILRQDTTGKTLLHYASYLDLELISLYLLSLGANLGAQDREGQNCFHVLAYKGNFKTLNVILNQELHRLRKSLTDNMNMMKLGFGMTNINLTNTFGFILTASIDADLKIKAKKLKYSEELVRKLREYYAGIVNLYRVAITTLDSNRRNPLHYAALSKFTWCFKTAETLLSPPKVDDFDGFLEFFKTLQNLSSNPKKIDPRRYVDVLEEVQSIIGPQEYASYYQEFKLAVKSIIKTAINSKDKNGHTPLHISSSSGCYQIVKILVENEADKQVKDSKAIIPLQLASTKLVMKYLALPEDMAANGDSKSFEHLINSGYDANLSKNQYLLGSVHQAVIQGGILSTILNNQGDTELLE